MSRNNHSDLFSGLEQTVLGTKMESLFPCNTQNNLGKFGVKLHQIVGQNDSLYVIIFKCSGQNDSLYVILLNVLVKMTHCV